MHDLSFLHFEFQPLLNCTSLLFVQTDLLKEGEVPVPHPSKFKDTWDDVSVKMPCSDKNLFPMETEVGLNFPTIDLLFIW